MSEHIFTLPDLGEGTVEAEISEWHISVGDQVSEDQAIVDMMTDKAAVEVPSPVTGTVVSLGGEPGDIIAVGAPLVVFATATDESNTARQTAKPAAQAHTTPSSEPELSIASPIAPSNTPPAVQPSSNQASNQPSIQPSVKIEKEIAPVDYQHDMAPPPLSSSPTSSSTFTTIANQNTTKIQTSPAIRRLAQEHNVDLSEVTGSGPRGRILRSDFDRFVQQSDHRMSPITPSKRTGAREFKVIGMRRLIAQRMVASKTEIPHFSYIEEIDVTSLEHLRVKLNQQHADHGIKFSYLPMLVQAICKSLTQFPQCNARYDKERNVIVHHDPVHAGIATQTPDGLKVPVVHHAEAMTLTALAHEISTVAAAARDGSAPKSKLQGSTITITSLGKLGGIASTPVINQPEVAIIGVNRAVERPMIVNGGIQIRRMMNISASFDHRFVDGYDAAAFVQEVKVLLESPEQTFSI